MSKESSSTQDKSGTPASLLVSIVSAIIVFALAEIQNTFTLRESFAMRYVLMAYIGLGLALAFFWKRLEGSPFLKISGGSYLFGLWVSLFMTTLAPVLLKGESPFVHGQVMQQFGFGFVVFSGFMLVVALLQNQKMVPSLLLSSLGALGLAVTSSAGFFLKATHDDEGAIASHNAHGDEGEEISAHGKPSTMAAKNPGKDDEHGHTEGTADTHDADQDQLHDQEPVPDDHGIETSKLPAPVTNKALKGPKSKKTPVASLDHAIPSSKPKTSSPSSHGEGHPWSYEAGSKGPAHWGSIADEFRKCTVGQSQSPIDIPSAWPTLNDVSLEYKLTPLSIVDNGKTIQFNVGKNNYARIGGKPYELLQFHIHTPSEHWIDGRSSPLEIHFVHKDERDRLAVVGVMIETGAEHKAFKEMWNFVPQSRDKPASARDKVFNIASLVPAKTKVYRYRGSLTTPPCSENVLWSVASEKMTMSKEQIDAFRLRYKNNARPIQTKANFAH